MAGRPGGFEFSVVGETVEIRHHGRKAATLRNAAARTFLTEVETSDPQQLTARATGNDKRGNERSDRHRP